MAEYIYNDFNHNDRNSSSTPEENPPAAPYGTHDGAYSPHPAADTSVSPAYSAAARTGDGGVRAPKHANRGPLILTIVILCVVLVGFAVMAGFAASIISKRLSAWQDGSGTATQTGNHGQTVLYESTTAPVVSPDGAGTVADVAAAVADSVVEITTEYVNMSSYFQYVTSGAGSGVIISADGYIMTNNHVIEAGAGGSSVSSYADKIIVRLRNGEEYEAKLVGADASSDIAVLKIEVSGLKPAVFGDSKSLVVGQQVVAVGNPLGQLGGTVTDGIISALDREISVNGNLMNLLQTNAAVNPGNSGGGLFDMAGNLIGIVNAKSSATSSGVSVEGLGFAIPSNDAKSVAEQLMQYGYVRGRVSLYLNTIDVTDYSTARRYGLNALGLYVYSAIEGYNDDVMQPYDRIVSVNGAEIGSYAEMKAALGQFTVGDKITLTVVRDNKYIEVEVECFEAVPSDVSFES